MISILRSMRRRYIDSGETTKYLKHAIGEIVLIVIGILLALSVSNWNEDRQLRTAELRVYQNLKEQISVDAKDINGQLEYNAFYKSQYVLAMDIIQSDDRSRSREIAEIVGQLTSYSDYDRRGNIYETMVNSGDIRLVKNGQIIQAIIDLEESLMYMNRMEAIHYEAMMGYAIKAIKDVVNFSTGEVVKPDAIYSYEFQNLFFLFHKITDEKHHVYQAALQKIGELTVLLDEELGKQ